MNWLVLLWYTTIYSATFWYEKYGEKSQRPGQKEDDSSVDISREKNFNMKVLNARIS